MIATNRLLAAASLSVIAACASDEAEEPSKSDAIVVTATKRSSMPIAAEPEVYGDVAYAPALGLGSPVYEQAADTSRYDNGDPNPVKRTTEEPVSTFSSDVDTSSYSLVRRALEGGQMPPSEAVRTEELINAFDYAYPVAGSAAEPFAPSVTLFETPWDEKTELLRIGVRGYDLEPEEEPDSNVVLLLDVSGSMNAPDKLPLVRESMKLLAKELDADDTLSIVVYAGAAGVVLEPTPGDQTVAITQALDRLSAGGSTAGGQGIELAYALAEQGFEEGAVNRVILATDGDFNVGVTSDDSLEDLVARKRETGIYLSVLGFGAGNLNDAMMQRIAQNGNGIAAYIDDLPEARRVLVREFSSSMFPIADDLKFQVEFNPASVGAYRLIGYQTRQLREEEFDDDAIDAGDIGSGHTVTALYEVARTGTDALLPDRRYDEAGPAYDPAAELAFLRIRYKLPGEAESRLIERPITPADREANPDEDARFASAVAAFGERLSRSSVAESMSYGEIVSLANGAKGEDAFGDRAAFVQLVRLAGDLDEAGAD